MTFLRYYILGFCVLYSINLLYRLYYLLEYDIYIYHPRVSEWHVYRFRWIYVTIYNLQNFNLEIAIINIIIFIFKILALLKKLISILFFINFGN